MISKKVLWSILVLLIFCGCLSSFSFRSAPLGWKRFQEGDKFSFSAPKNLESQETHGIDSFAGQYNSPDLKLQFDYGMYSDPLENTSPDDFKAEKAMIGGHEARIVTFRSAGLEPEFSYWAGVHFPDLGDRVKLTMLVRSAKAQGQKKAKIIFHSIRFNSSSQTQ